MTNILENFHLLELIHTNNYPEISAKQLIKSMEPVFIFKKSRTRALY